jgi:hypothetical protein
MGIVKEDIPQSRPEDNPDLGIDKIIVQLLFGDGNIIFFDDPFSDHQSRKKGENIHQSVPMDGNGENVERYGIKMFVNVLPKFHQIPLFFRLMLPHHLSHHL